MPKEEPSPFSYSLSDDKTQLKLELNPGDFRYTAEQVARLAMFFANLRAQMTPEAHDTSAHDPVNIECDRYEVYQKPEDGTAQLYMRMPGFGWTWFHLSNQECLRLVEILNPTTPPPDTLKH